MYDKLMYISQKSKGPSVEAGSVLRIFYTSNYTERQKNKNIMLCNWPSCTLSKNSEIFGKHPKIWCVNIEIYHLSSSHDFMSSFISSSDGKWSKYIVGTKSIMYKSQKIRFCFLPFRTFFLKYFILISNRFFSLPPGVTNCMGQR